MLADKLATAEHLARAGLVFPALRGLIARGEPPDEALLYTADLGTGLFIKPRHGHGGRGAFSLRREAGGWSLDGGPAMDWPAVRARLFRFARQDDLLIQERLTAPTEIGGWVAQERPPVLRVTTARLPEGTPFLHSAILTLAVPGRNPRDFLRGSIHAPVDPAAGRLAAGLSLSAPRDRLERIPWNGAALSGRTVPGFREAVAAALSAMATLPPVPLVHWDLIPTTRGPILLEGNSAGNWILTTLAGTYGLDAGPLPPLLARWLPPDVLLAR
jgi:hypothetical protein